MVRFIGSPEETSCIYMSHTTHETQPANDGSSQCPRRQIALEAKRSIG